MKPFENAPDDLPALRLKLPSSDFGPLFRVADILLHVSDAVVAIDRHGRITYWNKAAERFYNWKAEEVIGKPLTDAYQFRWLKEGAEAEAAEALSGRG
ncbi:MAG TPA: PAS domain-containing protein, partial [Candidatus Manganitrophaceae bacterium]|nr:PAS domain-containing protein [Candidatus Manganitrophaceae bacterium]